MSKKKRDKMRFFGDDSDMMEEVLMTDEEWDFFDLLEYKIYKGAGYSKLSGGHCLITITDVSEDEDGEWLDVGIQVGVEGEHLSEYGSARYSRKYNQLDENY